MNYVLYYGKNDYADKTTSTKKIWKQINTNLDNYFLKCDWAFAFTNLTTNVD